MKILNFFSLLLSVASLEWACELSGYAMRGDKQNGKQHNNIGGEKPKKEIRYRRQHSIKYFASLIGRFAKSSSLT